MIAGKIWLLFEVTIAYWILSGLGLDSMAIRNSWLHLERQTDRLPSAANYCYCGEPSLVSARRYAGTLQSSVNLPDKSRRLKTELFPSGGFVCLVTPRLHIVQNPERLLEGSKAQRKLA